MARRYLKKSEIASFSTAGFGRNMIYTIMSMFLLIFYTDAVGLKPVDAGTLILVARVFDAANDPIMGMIVDRTRTKWGKMRPYLLFSPFLIAIATVLLFLSPDFSSYGAKLAYAYVTYLFWGIAFTIQDVPFWGLSSVITPLESERTKFLSVARVCCTVGGILPTLLVPTLKSSLGLKEGYFAAGLIFGVLGAALSLLAFFGTKERVVPPAEERPSVKENVKLLVTNKLLMLVIVSAVLGSTMVMANVSGAYVSDYLITDPGIIPQNMLMTVMTVAVGVGMLPAMALMPVLRKRFSLKQIYIGSALFGVLAHVALWLIGYSNIYVVLLCFVFMGFPLGVYNVITYALIADSVDYMEYKSGKRTDGICFACQTFISKLTAGLATFATSVVLQVFRFVQPQEALNALGELKKIPVPQSDFTRTGLFFMVTLLPAIGFALSIIPMLWNDYTGKKKEKIQQELLAKREAEGIKQESPAPQEDAVPVK